MKAPEIVKLRLKRDHFLNGKRRRAGSVIKLKRPSAEWLLATGRATEVSPIKKTK